MREVETAIAADQGGEGGEAGGANGGVGQGIRVARPNNSAGILSKLRVGVGLHHWNPRQWCAATQVSGASAPESVVSANLLKTGRLWAARLHETLTNLLLRLSFDAE